MSVTYWLDLFTGKTWEEFIKHGANISGYRLRKKSICSKVKPGDYFICYLTGIKRFIGVLEVQSEMYIDESTIWEDEAFPCRFKVKIIHQLNPETAVSIFDLKDRLSFFKNVNKNYWSGLFRGSPNRFKLEDGLILVEEIKKAVNNPVNREYDTKLYLRRPKVYESKIGVVTVPETEVETEETEQTKTKLEFATHEEIQWILLKLGSDLGLDVWVARNDRNRVFEGKSFRKINNLREQLPRQFDEATNRTIELIDVLWLNGDAIVAAFEVEHTSAIYSGLLRMSDLMSMQPNLKINLYIVAPEDRRDKVFYEINRPTFTKLKPPLPEVCRFISYKQLKKKIEEIGTMSKYLKPEFIDEISESCIIEEA